MVSGWWWWLVGGEWLPVNEWLSVSGWWWLVGGGWLPVCVCQWLDASE